VMVTERVIPAVPIQANTARRQPILPRPIPLTPDAGLTDSQSENLILTPDPSLREVIGFLVN
jgi:hypothetical protein